MTSTKSTSSEDTKNLKKLRGEIKILNRNLRLKVNKSYVDKHAYRSDSRNGLQNKIDALACERNELKFKKLELKNKKLKLMEKNNKLESEKQDLKAKVLDLKTAYRALKHSGKDEDNESTPCSERCCESSSEDSFDEDSSDESSSEEE